jgi:hypothetical protein
LLGKIGFGGLIGEIAYYIIAHIGQMSKIYLLFCAVALVGNVFEKTRGNKCYNAILALVLVPTSAVLVYHFWDWLVSTVIEAYWLYLPIVPIVAAFSTAGGTISIVVGN